MVNVLYKLKDLCKLSSAKRIFENEYVKDGVPFIRGQEVSDGSILDENARFECYISEDRYEEIKSKYGVPQKGDILITAVGTIGNLCVLKTNRKFYFKDGNIIRFSDFKENVDSEYLAYFMKSSLFKKQIEYSLIGAVQKALTMVMLNEVTIPLPVLDVQKKIASVLSTLDQRIENLRVQNRVLEQTAKTIYDYTFLQCAGHQTTYNKTLNRNIPAEWEVKSVNQMAKSYRGVAYDKSDVQKENNGGILVLRGNNIQDNNLVYDGNVVYIPENLVEDNQHIKKGDIIMTMSSGSKEHIGKCTMFQYDSKHTYGAFLTKFTPNRECRYYFYMNLISDYFKAKIKSVCNGTGINNLTNQTFNEIFFPYPDSKTLDVFEKTVTPIFDKMGVNTKQIETLTTQRNTLLPLLMTGQVEV